ncbi:hypothetical protein BB65665_12956 [Bacillus sp. 916]|nr:hypothetical protein BB65665_12956 [Bacillus sp. 916]
MLAAVERQGEALELVALAAGLAAVYGPANAPETPSKPCARHRGRPPALWIPRGTLGPH